MVLGQLFVTTIGIFPEFVVELVVLFCAWTMYRRYREVEKQYPSCYRRDLLLL